MNWGGLRTLFDKEVWRFTKVLVQTVLAPVVSALLFLMIFSHLLEDRLTVYDGVGYGAFLVPGLVMMTLIQQAFANASSSLIQSKMAGNIVFVLLAPISPLEFFLAFVGAAVVRGLLVGFGVCLAAWLWVDISVASLAWAFTFAVVSSAFVGAMGLIAGIWADKYEHLAAVQSFVIVPLSFLSGVFYSIHSLPEHWAGVSQFNPFFYMIDGFRYGFVGASDVSPWLSLWVSLGALGGVAGLALLLLQQGYKLRK